MRSSARGPTWRPDIAMEAGLFVGQVAADTVVTDFTIDTLEDDDTCGLNATEDKGGHPFFEGTVTLSLILIPQAFEMESKALSRWVWPLRRGMSQCMVRSTASGPCQMGRVRVARGGV